MVPHGLHTLYYHAVLEPRHNFEKMIKVPVIESHMYHLRKAGQSPSGPTKNDSTFARLVHHMNRNFRELLQVNTI